MRKEATMKAVMTRSALQLKNILFATDFSGAAEAAFPFAVRLAREFGASLHAVHAKAPDNYALPATEVWPIVNEQLEKETAALKEKLHNDYPDVTSDVTVLEGGVIGVVEHLAET